MNRALKTGTNLRDAKKNTMTNIRQISQVPTMNSFCLYLIISLLSFINKALKIQPSIHWGRLPYPTLPPRASCSINCIYHLVNVLFKFSVSFATEVGKKKKNRPSHGQCFNRGLRSTKDLKRASGHLSPPTNNVRDLKSLLLSWKTCVLVHLNA